MMIAIRLESNVLMNMSRINLWVLFTMPSPNVSDIAGMYEWGLLNLVLHTTLSSCYGFVENFVVS